MKHKGLLKSVLIMTIVFALMLIGTITAFADGTPSLSASSATLTTGATKHLIMKTALGNNVADSKVDWSSSDTSIATVSSGGYVKGVKSGSARIYAKYKGDTYSCRITVKNASLSATSATLTTGTTKHLTMKSGLGNAIADSNITWKSSDTSIAAVSSGGYVKGVKAGSATIKGTYKGKTYSCRITVKNASLSATSATLTTGTTKHLTMKSGLGNAIADSNITWKSSDTSIATVSSGGYVKGVKAGSATIKGTYKGKSYSCRITVKNASLSATSASILTGSTIHLTMKSGLGNAIADSNITWKSSDTSIATVSSGGYVKGVKAGSATIKGTYKGKTYSCKVTIKNPAKLSDTNITIMPKDSYHLKLQATNGETIPDSSITWKSSNTSAATINSNGYIKGIATGTATISAVYKGVTYKADLKVIKSDYSVGYSSMTLNKLDGETIPVTYTGNDSVECEIVAGENKILAVWEDEWDGNKINLLVFPADKTGTAKIRFSSEATEGYREITVNVKADDINEDIAAQIITANSAMLAYNAYWTPTSFDLQDAYYYTNVTKCSQSLGMVRFTYTINTHNSPIPGTATYCVHAIDSHTVGETSGTKHKIGSSMIKDIEKAVNSIIE